MSCSRFFKLDIPFRARIFRYNFLTCFSRFHCSVSFADVANNPSKLAQVLHNSYAAHPAFGIYNSPPDTFQPTNVDISLLLKSKEDNKSRSSSSPESISRSVSVPSSATTSVATGPQRASARANVPIKRSSPSGTYHVQSPAKKQSKWSSEEDAKIIQLRGDGMKWEDISKHLPGRSAISCRLHYQNYLERRSEWDEDRKNKLARLYERFKADMWSRIAEEMAIPWRAAEAMHWQMGENEMARRAGVTPFTLANANVHPGIQPSPRVHEMHGSLSARTSRDSTLHLTPPQLPSLAELTAGLPAFAPQPYHSQPSTPYSEYSVRRSLPPQPLYEQTNYHANERRYP